MFDNTQPRKQPHKTHITMLVPDNGDITPSIEERLCRHHE